MATNTTHIDASPHDVFTVLADGWRYSAWVVGTSHMSAVEAQWPAAGSVLYHATGVWPFVIRDRTVVESVVPDEQLVLLAYGKQAGVARISLQLEPDGDGCRLRMDETPLDGLGGLLHGRLLDLAIRWRNRESVRRLAALSERRTALE